MILIAVNNVNFFLLIIGTWDATCRHFSMLRNTATLPLNITGGLTDSASFFFFYFQFVLFLTVSHTLSHTSRARQLNSNVFIETGLFFLF